MKTLHRILVFSVLLAPTTGLCAPKNVATTSSAIVAVVNEEAITPHDLNARIKFVLATTNVSNTPDAIARLKPQILRALVDERLQLQEGRKNNIPLSEKEVAQAIASIENQREMPPGAIMQMLMRNNIPPETFLTQVKAQIVWGKLLQRKVRSQIRISEDEVQQMAKKLSAPEIKQELNIALLQLPVDKPAREKEVRQAAEKLVLEVRGGANFEELARQFAGGAAREGGKLPRFWVRPDDLDPMIARALSGAKAGSVSMPLRNAVGFTIIKVYDTRDLPGTKPLGTEITLKEITIARRSSTNEKDADALRVVAEQVAQHPGSCSDKNAGDKIDQSVATISVENTTQMLNELPAALKVLASGMKMGDVSTPESDGDAFKVYMLCGRRDGVSAPVDTNRARAAVYQDRMELEAQKYMRNLRRDAFIEIRG